MRLWHGKAIVRKGEIFAHVIARRDGLRGYSQSAVVRYFGSVCMFSITNARATANGSQSSERRHCEAAYWIWIQFNITRVSPPAARCHAINHINIMQKRPNSTQGEGVVGSVSLWLPRNAMHIHINAIFANIGAIDCPKSRLIWPFFYSGFTHNSAYVEHQMHLMQITCTCHIFARNIGIYLNCDISLVLNDTFNV